LDEIRVHISLASEGHLLLIINATLSFLH
jgi:hypothetical protein